MSEVIPYGRQSIDEDDIAAVVEVLRSDFLTTGPAVGRFEEALTQATGARHAVALNSGTSALHAMYFAAGIGPGDEIITSPLTFAATANAALYLGATARFVDIDADTGNLDPDLVEAAITERTKAIVPIDYAGHPADYDRLRTITDRHGLKLLADAAHSLGAT
jgi:perosamine synthetase